MSDVESPSPEHPKVTAGVGAAETSHRPAKHVRSPPHYHSRRRTGRIIICTILLVLLMAGITALVLYLVYRPSKVQFSVVSASSYGLNISGATVSTPSPLPAGAAAISTSMQFVMLSRNPNKRSSVRYDRLNAYLVYRGQPITSPTPLPALRQGRKSAVAVSPFLRGAGVPVHPDVAAALQQEAAAGAVGLRLAVMGRVRYLPGPFRSPWYGMFVACDLMLAVRNGGYGQVPLLAAPDCHVDT